MAKELTKDARLVKQCQKCFGAPTKPLFSPRVSEACGRKLLRKCQIRRQHMKHVPHHTPAPGTATDLQLVPAQVSAATTSLFAATASKSSAPSRCRLQRAASTASGWNAHWRQGTMVWQRVY
jgi:hypothetical protein